MHRFALSLATTVLALCVSSLSLADELPCPLIVSLDPGALDPSWQKALASLRSELEAGTAASCHGVALVVSMDRDAMRVLAHARDGSETSRLVRDPVGLSAVAFGLLVAAPGEEAPAAPAVAPAVDARPISIPPATVLPEGTGAVDRISLSASTGARAAFPTNVVMADFDVRVDIVLHRWVVSVGMRAAPFAAPSRAAYDDDAYDETALAIGFGREVAAGASSFVLTAGPSLTYMWMENDVLAVSTERAQLRLGGTVRWAYRLSPAVRINVTVDAEVAPSGLLTSGYPTGLAPFPAATFGLHVGTEAIL